MSRPWLRNCAWTIGAMLLVACGSDVTEPAATGESAGSSTAPANRSDAPSPSATPPTDLAGGWLMFSRFDESTHTFLSSHLIRPDGIGEVELPLPGPEGGGSWSPDGSQIAVMTVLEDGRIGTAIIRPDGTVDRVFEIPDETLNAVCTVWSPDGTRLACEAWDDADPSRGGVYAVRASDGGDLTRLTSSPLGMTDFPGVYRPDGSQLIIQRQAGESPGRLYVVDIAGGDEPQPLFGDQTFEDVGGFSSDGTSLLTSADGEIKLIDLDENVIEAIAEPGRYLFGPVWSPDGEWIAYSGSSGSFIADIIVSRPDGSERWQVTRTPANEIAVDWGPEAATSSD